jgi:hypothetical protein
MVHCRNGSLRSRDSQAHEWRSAVLQLSIHRQDHGRTKSDKIRCWSAATNASLARVMHRRKALSCHLHNRTWINLATRKQSKQRQASCSPPECTVHCRGWRITQKHQFAIKTLRHHHTRGLWALAVWVRHSQDLPKTAHSAPATL